MAAAKEKNTFTAAEVAELLRPLNQSIQALQEENAALKKKLEHMNEIFINAQRARFGRFSEKQTYVLGEEQMSLFNEAEAIQDPKAEEPTEKPLQLRLTPAGKREPLMNW